MTEKPSSLATKLAAQFDILADKVDNILRWHECDEWQVQRAANKLLPQFCSNTRVYRGRDCDQHWFELQLMPAEDRMPFEVQFKRYATPGRYWIYAFQWQPSLGSGQGPRVVYGSEGTEPIARSLKLLLRDLERPQVLRLFEEALSAERVVCRYHRDLTNLLRALAPRSKAAKLTERLALKTFETRKARLVAAGQIKADTPLPV